MSEHKRIGVERNNDELTTESEYGMLNKIGFYDSKKRFCLSINDVQYISK